MVCSSWIASFAVLPPPFGRPSPRGPGFASVALSIPLGLIFGRPDPPFSRAISSCSVANQSPQLRQLLPLLHHQALQLGMRKTVKICGRQHSQKESDSCPLVNRKILPPQVLPLLRSNFPIAREIRFSCSIVALFFVPA